MAIVLITGPVAEPVSLSDLKLQIGLSPFEDTDKIKAEMTAKLLRRHIAVARADCENRTRRVFLRQTWKLLLDGWPRQRQIYDGAGYPSIVLPKQPFGAVSEFAYVAPDGTTQNMSDYGYQVDPGSETQPARLTPPYAQPWPPLRLIPNNVHVTFTCGYGDDGSFMPTPITQAVLFLAHSYYDPAAFKDVDGLVDNLLSPYVNRIS